MPNPQSQQSVGGSFGVHVNTLQIIRDNQVDRYEIVPGKDPKFSDGILETPNCIVSCKRVQGTINKHGAYSLKWKKLLGSGGNGEIWEVEFTSQSSSVEYAAKNTKTLRDICLQNIALDELRYECEILKKLDHANIVKYMGFAEFQHDQISKKFVLLLEKCDGGDLLTMINDRHKIYSMYTVVYWAEQLFSALEYLRTRNLIHRDIKAENVLLSIKPNQPNLSPNKIEYDVKLCDFAFTIHRENTTFFLMETWEESPKGTYASMSPEVYNCMVCHRSDIFCLGLVLWFLIERRKFYSCPSEWKTYQTAKEQEPSFVNCRDDLRDIIYNCTRKKFDNRAQDAEGVRRLLETILQDYQNGTARALGLELAVETDLNEQRKIRPLGFDDTKQRKECASSCVMLNKALSSLSKIGETTDHEPSDRHRKHFLEKFDDVQQASLDAKAIYAGQSAIFSKRYKEIDPEFSKSEKIRSDRIDLNFKQILIADFKHQADVFKSTFDVLIETVNIPATEVDLPEKLSPFEHFNHGCWDLLELLGGKLKAIEIIKSACYNLSFRFCFYKLKSFDGKPTHDHFYLLHKSSKGGLFMRKVSTQRTLHFIAGSWKNEKFCMDSREISPSLNSSAEVSPIDMTEWIKQEMIKLNGYAKHYHEGFFPNFTFQLSDYVFQLQIPPRHSSTCKNPDDLILKAGFPGEVDNDYRIGNCKCTNDDEIAAYIKTYTKICKVIFLVNRKGVKIFEKKHSTNGFSIDFQSCAESRQEIVADWKFYVHRDEQKIALNHPKYFPADHKIDILLVDQMYNLSRRNPIAEDSTRNEQISIDIFEIFNFKEPAAKKRNMFFSEI